MNIGALAFTSSSRYEYLDTKGSVLFTTSGGTPNSTTVTIAHDLGYIPFFRLFIQFPSDNNCYSIFNGPTLLLGNWEIESVSADTSNISITLDNFTTSVLSGTIYYRIYAEPQT